MSVLRQRLTEYVEARRALGTQLREPAMALGHFLDFLEREGKQYITTELALRWARQPERVQPATWARRLTAVRRFAAWLSGFDERTEVPPIGLIKARHHRNKPYIYTDQQVVQLMDEADQLPSPTGLRALTYVTFIGLLFATGLRPGEALALDMSDVDLQNGVLAIRETKFGKSRFVPVAESTRSALAHYSRRRDRLCPGRSTDAFLVSERGHRLVPCTARRTFAKLSCAIGLRTTAANHRIGRGPRLQDLRHTFATQKLVEWYRSGLDVEREMPKLATYLGHVNSANTYWYIESVPEILQLATEYLYNGRGGAQ